MKKIILLLLPALALAQFTKGTVKDSVTGKPIPYASIWIQNEDVSAMADSLGQYAIRTTNAGKSLVFSAAGYKSKTVKLPETPGLKMTPIPIVEPAVKPSGKKTRVIGNQIKARSSDLTFGSKGKPWMLARKFTPAPENCDEMLKEIKLYTNCHNNNMKLALRFFEVADDGQPGRELVDRLVIFRVDLGRELLTVDLMPYRIALPKNGVFVAISWLIIDQNVKKWYDKRPMQFKDYDPGVGVVPTEVNTSWEYSGGRWAEMPKFPMDYDMRSFRGKFAEVAMQLTITN